MLLLCICTDDLMKILNIASLIVFALLFNNHVNASIWESLMMPGELIDNHAKYENDCNQCHESFDRKKQSRLCMQCHKKIKYDINNKKGYHGKTVGIKRQECNTCHTDHKGRKVDIIKLDKQTFNHKKTDFPLKGKHTTVACQSCHLSDKKYRQAANDCYSCHKKNDTHKNKLGKKCQQCHSESNWRKTRFDHEKTDFPLKGKHDDISCESCHINQNYKKTPSKCVRCHITKDVHAGDFGESCEKCHQSTKWTSITFKHNLDTKFKLKGAHKNSSCDSCHDKNPYKHKTSKQCINCHEQDDSHRGIMGKKCQTCHKTSSWKKHYFKHNKDTRYNLMDKHTDARCHDCHQKPARKKNKIRTCYACHQSDDTHQGSQGKTCNNCHSTKSWTGKVTFDHDLSDYPLIGLHASTSCDGCHADGQFKKTPTGCISCHQQDDFHKSSFGKKCHTCHNPNGWKRWTFDHDRQTDFKLKDAHQDLECHACHLLENKNEPPGSTCNECHAKDDVHNGGFGIQCEQCHTQDSFNKILMLR